MQNSIEELAREEPNKGPSGGPNKGPNKGPREGPDKAPKQRPNGGPGERPNKGPGGGATGPTRAQRKSHTHMAASHKIMRLTCEDDKSEHNSATISNTFDTSYSLIVASLTCLGIGGI